MLDNMERQGRSGVLYIQLIEMEKIGTKRTE